MLVVKVTLLEIQFKSLCDSSQIFKHLFQNPILYVFRKTWIQLVFPRYFTVRYLEGNLAVRIAPIYTVTVLLFKLYSLKRQQEVTKSQCNDPGCPAALTCTGSGYWLLPSMVSVWLQACRNIFIFMCQSSSVAFLLESRFKDGRDHKLKVQSSVTRISDTVTMELETK